jgi:DNA (cytosine-5)-methyltransferase 1
VRLADAVDLFAGAGGWDVAARALGLDVIGVDDSREVERTRDANGLRTVCSDVRDVDPLHYLAEGLIASPPCQTFSIAGKGTGRAAFDDVQLVVEALAARAVPPTVSDVRTSLVVEPLRWALARVDTGNPFDWIALEQVPMVLPVWHAIADVLLSNGYHVSTGHLSAEQYGVPQTRKRAFLIANRHEYVHLPWPTHVKYRKGGQVHDDEAHLLPWVSMAQALDWGESSMLLSTYSTHSDYQNRGKRWGTEPAPTITTHANRNKVWHEQTVGGLPRLRNPSGLPVDTSWPAHRPSTTVAGRALVVHPGEIANRFNGSHKSRNDGVRLTVAEGAALQTFPPDYVWPCGLTATWEQIGNAVPPLLARTVLLHAMLGGEGVERLLREDEPEPVCVECGNDLAMLGSIYCLDCAEVFQ